MSKIRIAIIKFGGLSIGGSERFLQVIAANLSRDLFDVDYYYCDAAPYLGSSGRHANTSPDRLQYMQDKSVRLIQFHVAFRDLTRPTFDWIGTNFWELFDEHAYDLALTVKSGHPEYPFTKLKIPLIEIVGLPAGIDPQPVVHIHPSQYQRKAWLKMGGDFRKSCVIPPPPTSPHSNENLRLELQIPDDAVVAGFHQRADNAIFSSIPLQAFSRCFAQDRHFVLLGGGQKYRDQARELLLNNVHFLPETGNPTIVSQFLNTLDFFAHGRGDGETYGAVFAEAMLHGKPCLSHAVSKGDNAQPETIGPAGWFATSLEEYTIKFERLYRDPEFRKILARKSISHAQEYFSLESCIEALTRLFQKICGRQECPPTKKKIPYGISPLGFLYAGDMDRLDQIAHHVLTGHIPEDYHIQIVKFFLPHVRTFIDIGANTGLYGFVAAKECAPEAKIHCFEPQIECCRILSKTIDLNNWEQKVIVHSLGLSDQLGELLCYFSETGTSFDPSFIEDVSVPQQVVPVSTLDQCARDLSIQNIDFIKIDVEGFEYKVLEGAREVVKKYRPILFIEIAGRLKNRKAQYIDTISWLQSRGYAIYRCHEWRTRYYHFGNISKITEDKAPRKIFMYLCIPCEREKESIKKLRKYLRIVNKTLIKTRIRSARVKLLRLLKEKLKKTSLYPLFYRGRNVIFRAFNSAP